MAGLIFGGLITGCTFLFTGRWAYNWGAYKWGEGACKWVTYSWGAYNQNFTVFVRGEDWHNPFIKKDRNQIVTMLMTMNFMIKQTTFS